MVVIAPNEAQILADFVAEIIGKMGLSRWKVLVMDEPAPEDSLATITLNPQRYIAELKIGYGWPELSLEEKREVLLHETLHLWHYRLNHIVEDLEDSLSDKVMKLVWKRYTREVEYMVDQISIFLTEDKDLAELWDKVYGEYSRA